MEVCIDLLQNPWSAWKKEKKHKHFTAYTVRWLFSADVCASAKMLDNNKHTGFVYHPTDCDKFIQCHIYESDTVAVYRTCPLGQYWNHAHLRCDEACDVDCPYGELVWGWRERESNIYEGRG